MDQVREIGYWVCRRQITLGRAVTVLYKQYCCVIPVVTIDYTIQLDCLQRSARPTIAFGGRASCLNAQEPHPASGLRASLPIPQF